MSDIAENARSLLKKLEHGNGFGEPVRLVAATKTRTPEEINEAVAAGIGDVGENKVQEFCEKYDALLPCRRHFIGHLQTNKVKYLIGKTALVHSVDRDELALELAARSQKAGIETDVLVQINIGHEASKGGYPPEEGMDAFERISRLEGLKLKGFMAMLPASGEKSELILLVRRMRELFEGARERSKDVEFLSMGMSGDFELCLEYGSNMIRVGSAIFGERNYAAGVERPKNGE